MEDVWAALLGTVLLGEFYKNGHWCTFIERAYKFLNKGSAAFFVGFARPVCHAMLVFTRHKHHANTMQAKPCKRQTPRTAQVGAAMHHAQKLIEHA